MTPFPLAFEPNVAAAAAVTACFTTWFQLLRLYPPALFIASLTAGPEPSGLTAQSVPLGPHYFTKLERSGLGDQNIQHAVLWSRGDAPWPLRRER